MWSKQPYTFDRVVRIFFSAIFFGVLIYLAYVLRHVLLPFVVALLIAYLIEPWVRVNQKMLRIKSHRWAVVLTTFETALIFALLCVILIPIVEKEFSQLSVILDKYLSDDRLAMSWMPENIHEFIHKHLNIQSIIAEVQKINVSQFVNGVWDSLTSGLDKILGMLGWLICVVYVLFILLDFDKYKNGLIKYVPNRYMPAVTEVLHDTSWTMKRYFRNQALISLIVGVCYTVGFSIVGIPMAVVIGLTNILLFMVPYMVYISVIPVTIMCLFKSMETGVDFWLIWVECIAVYAFVEAFSDLVLTPRIMGKALGLDPAIILLSLSIWGTLLGLLGMLIALPVTTIILKWTKLGLASWRDNCNAESG